MAEKIKMVDYVDSTMGKYLQMLADEFKEKIDHINELEEQVEYLFDSRTKNLKQVEEQNNWHVMQINCLKEIMLE